MTLEEFEQRSTELLETASTWTMETAPQTLNDFPLFPPSVFELFETIKSSEEKITVSESMLIWNSELTKILPDTITGMEYHRNFDYVDGEKNAWESLKFETVGDYELAVQLPEGVWENNNRYFKLSLSGYSYYDEWQETLQIGYNILDRQIDGADYISLSMGNNKYSISWDYLVEENLITVDIYTWPDGRIWYMTYDAVSGSLINMTK